MVNKCSLKDCRCRKEKLKVSLFQGPDTKSEQAKWSAALGENVTELSKICELNFRPEDIVSEKVVTDGQGNVICREPAKRKKLKKGACPLDRCCKGPPSKQMRLDDGSDGETTDMSSFKIVDNYRKTCADEDAASKENVSNNIGEPATKFISNILLESKEHTCTEDIDLVTEKKESVDDGVLNINLPENNQYLFEDIHATTKTTNSTSKDHEVSEEQEMPGFKTDQPTFFNTENLNDKLWGAMGNLKLPSPAWVLTVPMQSKIIMLSLLDGKPSPSGSNNIVPVFIKQVIVHEDSRIQVRIHDKNVDMRTCAIEQEHLKTVPKTVEEFESFLNNLDQCPVCVGGPSLSLYKDVDPENAYRDRTVWRHKKCSQILSRGNICISCSGLHKTLSQNLSRKQNKKPDDITRLKRKFKIRLPMLSSDIKKKVDDMRKRKKVVTQRLHRKEKKLKEALEELNDVHHRLNQIKETTFETQLKNHSTQIPENQMTLIKECFAAGKKKNAKGRRYNDEWILLCLLLYIRSSAAYNMLRKSEVLPLPCKTTITRYLRATNVGCGFDDNFFELFSESLKCQKELATNGILSFDEMSVRTSIEVDTKTMTFEGMQDYGKESDKNASTLDQKADHALVFMFSSLAANFHQPIATFASKGPTSSNVLSALVLLAIMNVEKAGGKVHGIVCDGATTNRSMWKELGISGKLNDCNFSFENPFDERRFVYAFSDAPHLIKCIRNRFEEKKVLKVNGEYVKWDYYKYLYEHDCVSPSELRVCPKITQHHINPTKSQKMRVSLATQVFSKSVADGLKLFHQTEKLKNPSTNKFDGYEGTMNFTMRINNMFDALNRSYSAQGIRKNSKDLEVLEETIEWLDQWERETVNKDLFLTDQTAQGLRVTLHSTLHLTNYLLNSCGFLYVLTNKMNQDCLEQFFGCIRQAGCQNDHPTLHTFKQLYHLLSIYQIVKPPKFGNCSVTENVNERKKITLQDLRRIFPDIKKSYRQEHLKNLQDSLEDLISYDEWECEDMFESDVSLSEVEDCVVYYISGFAARKLRTWTKCTNCKKAFNSAYENLIAGVSAANLVNIKTLGGLIHPNIHLFELFKNLEIFFQSHKDSVNAYHLIIEDLLKSNYHFTFPCEEHKTSMTSNCIHYYITMRMRQYCKIKNREAAKTSQHVKKQSKHYST